MKGAGYYIIFFIIFVVIVVPGLIVKSCKPIQFEGPSEQKRIKEAAGENFISVYINSSKKIEKILLEDYVKGVVAAEMPASFNIEALKAQSVAARTYVYKRWRTVGGNGCSLHPEADVCDDPSHCQAWITKSEMLKKWGLFSYYHYYSKINQAVNSTAGMIILYQDEPIDPLFFSTSNGKTENSEDVWEKQIPYLRSVVSPDEEAAPRFFAVKEFTVEEIVSKLRQKWPDIVIDHKNPQAQWKVLEVSEGGRVKKMQVGNKVIKGTEFRQLFELNSTDFKWERSGKNIKIMTTGYGHGVGMSQYGADAMAKNGAGYIDIIKHYYKGVEIIKKIE
ncbi:Stage II sporulation protein D [Tepidanaerobacter acetatoxydans Re1]|uniref:Stage II sporulation protein D n=1 Tax=Tepidanaerobacter acetatoxydans (strain DSM 21804 / JCM 16047 / Re1) TaxID=1209989 RepID=F4LR44_TEPAE|nr:stage II sporulation protein D [Tepidanaerobacter acetatoxydans]AEE92197.1 stage II sporulation protein D [Tepidanaerobacter acetatoxydans Re1]CDI40933.1 Stage II sporulation protein D [Tepidanaerobacter acetatoxydans Re1]